MGCPSQAVLHLIQLEKSNQAHRRFEENGGQWDNWYNTAALSRQRGPSFAKFCFFITICLSVLMTAKKYFFDPDQMREV